MSAKPQAWPFKLAAVFSVGYFGIAVWLFLLKTLQAQSVSGDGFSISGMLTLSEWGDFLAGVSSPLALIWIIASVIIQGIELKEQRAEMAKQVDALNAQADFIKTELDRDTQEKAWTDILFLLDELREMIPLPQDCDGKADHFFTFKVRDKDVKFLYLPPDEAAVAGMRTVRFLGRAAGGVKYPVKKLADALEQGEAIGCPNSRSNFDKMLEIVNFIVKLQGNLPDHKKIILAGCRTDEWQDMLTTIKAVFDRNGSKR